MSFSPDYQNNKPFHLPLLLIISIISHFPFVLKGFGEIDATKIAVSVIDILNHSSGAAFANFYFSDVIPLYIVYLKWFMKLLDHNYTYLPLVMNYTNAVIGTLIVIPAYYLVKNLFRNSAVAFCSVLSLIFTPSFYQSTIMGFPHLIAFFFMLISLNCYLSTLDKDDKSSVIFMMIMSCVTLTVAFLFKSDYVLGAGAFFGLLFLRKIKDKSNITRAFIIIFIAGVLFLLLRNLMLGPSSGTTMSKEGLSKWYEYSLIIPSNFTYLIRQTKPIAYGAGLITFFLGIAALLFYLAKRRWDVLGFILSWAALPTMFWIVMIGNNARHNMLTILPMVVLIIFFFLEKFPRHLLVLTAALIIGNFFITSPSPSILTPSGSLFKSHAMLEEKMLTFHSRADDISIINEDKIAVLGYFHNPHVVFEIMKASPSYEAVKIGREDYKIKTDSKEFMFLYFVVVKPEYMEERIKYFINKYDIKNYVFTSATYDLKPLSDLGLKTRTFDIIQRKTL